MLSSEPKDQDTFDHDKGQKSANLAPSPLDFLNLLQWIFFPFSPGFLCNLVRTWPQNVEKIAQFPGGEKSVESCHVSGCHGFFSPEKSINLFGQVLDLEDQ